MELSAYRDEEKVRAASIACLNSIPDDVILDMATREFHMVNSNSCVCGWAFRAGMTKLFDTNKKKFQRLMDKWGFGSMGVDGRADIDDFNDTVFIGTESGCLAIFNQASYEQWDIMYMAVASTPELYIVEQEFVERLNRIFEKPKKTRK